MQVLNKRLTKKGEQDPSYLLLNEISYTGQAAGGPRALNSIEN